MISLDIRPHSIAWGFLGLDHDIAFDFRLGRFSMLVERWPRPVPLKVDREGRGEIIIDLHRYRLMLTDHSHEPGYS